MEFCDYLHLKKVEKVALAAGEQRDRECSHVVRALVDYGENDKAEDLIGKCRPHDLGDRPAIIIRRLLTKGHFERALKFAEEWHAPGEQIALLKLVMGQISESEDAEKVDLVAKKIKSASSRC